MKLTVSSEKILNLIHGFSQDFLDQARRTPEQVRAHTSVCNRASDKCNAV